MRTQTTESWLPLAPVAAANPFQLAPALVLSPHTCTKNLKIDVQVLNPCGVRRIEPSNHNPQLCNSKTHSRPTYVLHQWLQPIERHRRGSKHSEGRRPAESHREGWARPWKYGGISWALPICSQSIHMLVLFQEENWNGQTLAGSACYRFLIKASWWTSKVDSMPVVRVL